MCAVHTKQEDLDDLGPGFESGDDVVLRLDAATFLASLGGGDHEDSGRTLGAMRTDQARNTSQRRQALSPYFLEMVDLALRHSRSH